MQASDIFHICKEFLKDLSSAIQKIGQKSSQDVIKSISLGTFISKSSSTSLGTSMSQKTTPLTTPSISRSTSQEGFLSRKRSNTDSRPSFDSLRSKASEEDPSTAKITFTLGANVESEASLVMDSSSGRHLTVRSHAISEARLDLTSKSDDSFSSKKTDTVSDIDLHSGRTDLSPSKKNDVTCEVNRPTESESDDRLTPKRPNAIDTLGLNSRKNDLSPSRETHTVNKSSVNGMSGSADNFVLERTDSINNLDQRSASSSRFSHGKTEIAKEANIPVLFKKNTELLTSVRTENADQATSYPSSIQRDSLSSVDTNVIRGTEVKLTPSWDHAIKTQRKRLENEGKDSELNYPKSEKSRKYLERNGAPQKTLSKSFSSPFLNTLSFEDVRKHDSMEKLELFDLENMTLEKQKSGLLYGDNMENRHSEGLEASKIERTKKQTFPGGTDEDNSMDADDASSVESFELKTDISCYNDNNNKQIHITNSIYTRNRGHQQKDSSDCRNVVDSGAVLHSKVQSMISLPSFTSVENRTSVDGRENSRDGETVSPKQYSKIRPEISMEVLTNGRDNQVPTPLKLKQHHRSRSVSSTSLATARWTNVGTTAHEVNESAPRVTSPGRMHRRAYSESAKITPRELKQKYILNRSTPTHEVNESTPSVTNPGGMHRRAYSESAKITPRDLKQKYISNRSSSERGQQNPPFYEKKKSSFIDHGFLKHSLSHTAQRKLNDAHKRVDNSGCVILGESLV